MSLSISRKMPDNSLVSVTVGTEMEDDTDDPQKLFDKVRRAVIRDLNELVDKDEIAAYAVNKVRKNIQNEKRIAEALADEEC